MRNLRALIVGGGIGGLSAAIGLRQAGFEVAIYERAQEWREIGAGIVLAPNAIQALGHLSLADRVAGYGLPVTTAVIKTSKGAPILSTDGLAGYPNICLQRADLQRALVESCWEQDLPIALGHECVGFEQQDGTVGVHFANGHTAVADLLIGADGLRSRVRAGIHGEAKPRYAGYAAWRAMTSFDTIREVSESWGAGRRFGIVPIGNGRIYWFATRNVPEGEAEPPEARKPLLLDLFAGWHDPVEPIIKATKEGAILRHDLHDRKPLRPPWGVGRVTLLGDAAHPATPNLGQGACMAIEDAVVLAHRLGSMNDVENALREYEAQRALRTAQITNLSWRLGQIGQLQNPVARGLRNALVRLTPSRVQQRRMEKLLHFDV